VINPSSGRGDVVAVCNDVSIVAEYEGGIVNARHGRTRTLLQRNLCGRHETTRSGAKPKLKIFPGGHFYDICALPDEPSALTVRSLMRWLHMGSCVPPCCAFKPTVSM
jgi:hypothetical protein